MKYDPNKHNRRSIRLKGYDYSQPAWYFVTICTQNREILFGDVFDGKMALNTFGKIIDYHWEKTPKHFKHIIIDEYQIMPNHFHGIINIVGAMHSDNKIKLNKNKLQNYASPLPPRGTTPGSLGAIMQNFQSITSRKINNICKTPGIRLWQRNYYERIIRDESELNRIRTYIIENPMKWQDDKYFNR